MNRDELQARWILSQGWVSAELLKETAAALPRAPGHDLCSLLIMRGLINEAAAAQVREALGSGQNRPGSARYSDKFKTMAIPAPASKPKSSSRRFARDSRRYAQVQQAAYPPESRRYSRDGFAVSTDVDNMETIVAKDPALKKTPLRLAPGQRFQEYEILDEISRGSMGVVYKARNSDGEVLALKIIQAEHDNEENARRFGREAETLIRLEHPNIIKVRDYGSHKGRLFYAMDRVDGRDLLELVQSAIRQSGRPPPWRKTVAYLEGIARALAHCHENHIIHRDVKPQNVLIGRKSLRPILVDFGLMKRVPALEDSASSMGLTKTGETVGTPAFMSPEQYNPGGEHGKPGAPTDVWGFAATLFYALTGLPPFNKPTPVEIYRAITAGERPSLAAVNPRIPAWIDELCSQCLEPSPEYRPPMKEVAERLRSGLMTSEESPAPPLKSRSALVLPSVIAALALGLAAAAFTYDRPQSSGRLPVLERQPSAPFTSRAELEISGQTEPGKLLVSIAGEVTRSDRSGRFARTFPLQEGHNRFVVGLPSAKGLLDKQVLVVVRDTIKPHLVFRDPENGRLNGPQLVIAGQVLDANPTTLTVNDEAVELEAKGHFVYEFTDDPDIDTLDFVCLDAAGNRETLEFDLASLRRARTRDDGRDDSRQARIWAKKPEFYEKLEAAKRAAASLAAGAAPEPAPAFDLPEDLRPLADLELWDRSKPEDQDRAIEAVARRLANLTLVEAREFSCAGSTHRLGVFRHESSGLEFVLLPGTTRPAEWAFDQRRAQEIAWLRAASAAEVELEDILWLISNRRLENFGDVFHRALPEEAASIDERPVEERLALAQRVLQQPEKLKRFRGALAELADLIEDGAPRRESLERLRPFLLARFEAPLSLVSERVSVDLPRSVPRNRLAPEVFATLLERFGFRLPTLLEWEYACAAGGQEKRFWGDPAQLKSFVWHRENSRTGSFPKDNKLHADRPNSFGLVDIVGNLAELATDDHEAWARAWAGIETVGEVAVADRLAERRRGYLILGGNARVPAAFQALPWTIGRLRSSREVGARPAISIPDLGP